MGGSEVGRVYVSERVQRPFGKCPAEPSIECAMVLGVDSRRWGEGTVPRTPALKSGVSVPVDWLAVLSLLRVSASSSLRSLNVEMTPLSWGPCLKQMKRNCDAALPVPAHGEVISQD